LEIEKENGDVYTLEEFDTFALEDTQGFNSPVTGATEFVNADFNTSTNTPAPTTTGKKVGQIVEITANNGVHIFIVTSIIGLVYTFGKHIIKLDYSLSKQLSPAVRSVTLAIDGIANALAGELMNDVYKPIVKYGKWYQTISAVTGINYLKGYDTRLRKFLDKVLENNHCKDAVTEMEKKIL
jgi:hypothetical protein